LLYRESPGAGADFKPACNLGLLYQTAIKEILFGGTGVSPVQAQAKASGYHELFFYCNSVLLV
jgi:hypothetical protein